MPLTPADLAAPIDWKAAKYQDMLQDLQANILKGHGRHHTRNVFLRVKAGQGAAARIGVHNIAPFITSAERQLLDVVRFKASGLSGGTTALFFLTAAGYTALGAAPAKLPADASFRAGMPAKGGALSDPATALWDAPFKSAPHALLLLADGCDEPLGDAEKAMLGLLGAGWEKAGDIKGEAIFDEFGQGIEHFGYMDGRSQPLMLADEVAGEPAANWNPGFGPGEAALVRDPAGGSPDSFGSYFIFRKLQQDVKGFNKAEDKLAKGQAKEAKKQHLPKPDDELAGAQMVGRFENGRPVTGTATPNDPPPPKPDNDFNYGQDANGSKCPFHAHIRKVNPRDGSERSVLMPRRGIPFGGPEGSKGPVGLLFMAYNNSIARQFEFTQQSWANNPNFQKAGTGVDPIIGQGVTPRPKYNCPAGWNDPADHRFPGDFQQFVTMKGGDYFFAPSKSGLANL
jgi:Dyp-type peroxidase family